MPHNEEDGLAAMAGIPSDQGDRGNSVSNHRLMIAEIIGDEVIIYVSNGPSFIRELVIDLKKKNVVRYETFLAREQ